MALDYRVSAWDMNSNTKIMDCRGASNRSFNVRLNDAGEFSFNIPLKYAAPLLDYRGQPFKVLFTANADSLVLYTGIKWTEKTGYDKAYVQYGGKEQTSYFQEVFIPNDYKGSYLPGALISQVVSDVQTVEPGANRGITVKQVGFNSPPAITAAYAKIQYPTVAQILADMTASVTPGTGGVDYYMQDTFVNHVPQHTMVVQSPRCGRDHNSSKLSIDLDRGAVKWDWPVDAFSTGNHVVVIGSGSGQSQPTGIADAPEKRGGKGQLPLLDIAYQYSHIQNPTQLQGIANGLSQQVGRPIETPNITIPANYAGCQLGSFLIGDDVLIRSKKSLWFPNGLYQWWRIVNYKVVLPDQGVPTVELTLNRPPIY